VGNSPHWDGARQIPRVPLQHDNLTTRRVYIVWSTVIPNYTTPTKKTLERSLKFRFSAVYVTMVGPKCELSAEVFDVMSFDNISTPQRWLQRPLSISHKLPCCLRTDPATPSSINGYRDRRCSQAVRKSMHTSPKYHINSLLSGSVTLPRGEVISSPFTRWRSAFAILALGPN
jgi:hypothetical protein